MYRFFHPSSVAVFGVSSRQENLARAIVDNLYLFGFQGPVYQISPKGGEYRGQPIYQRLNDLPETPEVAAVLTPASTLPDIFKACGEKGIRRLVVETAGFTELAEENKGLEDELKQIAAIYGIRFVGPNCIGLISTHSGLSLPFTSFAQAMPKGGLSIISQSGGIGITYLESCTRAGLGISKFASVGNKLNLIESDFLAYLLDDPETEAILFYLESIVDGRRLYDLIRKSSKPVVVHKSNIAPASNQAAHSHTAALANDDAVVEAALRQAGAIRAQTVDECLEILKGLALPRPKGRRMAVISRSGGHAVVAADAAFRQGMELVEFPDSYLESIGAHLRASVIKLGNPLDLGDIFDFDAHIEAARRALALELVDCLAMVGAYRGDEIEEGRELLRRLGTLSREHEKPLALCLLSDPDEMPMAESVFGQPLFSTVENAIMALSRAASVGTASTPLKSSNTLNPDLTSCRQAATGAGPDGILELPEALALIKAAGVPVAPHVTVSNPNEAAEAGASLGFPVVLKAVGVSHKTEQGGVVLGIGSKERLGREAAEMISRLDIRRLVVMKQMNVGEEVILGGKRDQAFGALVLFGLGGVTAEVLKDISLRLAPVDEVMAGSMLDGLRGAPLLKGFRGRPVADRDALLKAISKISSLIYELPEIQELDINPLLAGPDGVVAVDARAVVKKI